jgi:hypothetical protein
MKRCLQLVVLSLVTLLAIPPALAKELCLLSQGSQPMEDLACCADSGDGWMGHASQTGASSAPTAQAQVCNEGCCSVSQNTPLPGTPEKATSARASLGHYTTIAAFVPGPVQRLGHSGLPNAVSPDRQLLLHVFRI